MEPNWAAENLQVIRTLMERSALYRRALAPVMLFLGLLGIVAALAGWQLDFRTARSFVAFWLGTSLAGVAGAFVLVRRQSLKDAEPFWSPPTRRVTQAVLPGLAAGCFAGVLAAFPGGGPSGFAVLWLPPVWMALYGCAIHAAGFFMQRGIKLFGWLFIASASAASVYLGGGGASSLAQAHALMGAAFGGLHLAYGIYLCFTESRKNEA